jgi:hypothetical protein
MTSSLSTIALDRTDRTVDWRLSGRPQTSASADPGTPYLGLYEDLVAIDRATGRIARQMTMQSVASGPPIVTDGAGIALDGPGTLYGIDTGGRWPETRATRHPACYSYSMVAGGLWVTS